MPNSAVVLKIARGQFAGATIAFDKPSISVLGRGDSCFPRLPNDELHKDVSRYHCLLIINPPQAFIQDLGSCNGTYVNGARLQTDLFLESSIVSLQRIPSARYLLSDGDQFTLGENAVFQVAIVEDHIPAAGTDEDTFERSPERNIMEDPKCLFSAENLANVS